MQGSAHPDKRARTRERVVAILSLHILIAFYSLASVCSKIAAQAEFLSLPFILWYGADLALLGIYALGWQQVLKHLELTTAYANKGITIAWGFLWGTTLFSEHISLFMCVGAAIVFVGIVLVVISDD